jgi:sugar O-acyltransferase (sialic acid O-acetyltransferase NeuD family)
MERKKLVIVGAGGMGREVLFQLLDINSKTDCYDILGFIDNMPDLQGKVINDFSVLGDDLWLLNYPDEINVVLGIGNAQARKRAAEKFFRNKHIVFPNIIANEVKYSESVTMGEGCIIGFYSTLTVNISIGNFVIMLRQCSVGHDSSLGDFVTLYPGVSVSGNVAIGNGTEIGTGANIIQGKSIGDNSIIGAGAVVIHDVPSNCTAVGVPAKPIK